MHDPIIFLNGNDGTQLLAWGHGPRLSVNSGSALSKLDEFVTQNKGEFLFGYLAYDLKNEVHDLESNSTDNKGLPELFFWCPPNIVISNNGNPEVEKGENIDECLDFFEQFMSQKEKTIKEPNHVNFTKTLSKSEYLKKVSQLQKHIIRGDIYEVNFCQEFVATNVSINNTASLYWELNRRTLAPFSSFLEFDEFSIFSGSPERFLQKMGDELRSEPIKGTSKRGGNFEEDLFFKKSLRNDDKERAENIMIVDLVRNDFSRIASVKNVYVKELCEIYSFKTVHQMISTVTCEVDPKCTPSEILSATFPMGSMTGAPKKSAMELIEKHENFKRGIYSGAIGYFAPNGDFDFNVVIRTLVHNHQTKTMSCGVGSAITHLSHPEKEWQECLTKVQKLIQDLHV